MVRGRRRGIRSIEVATSWGLSEMDRVRYRDVVWQRREVSSMTKSRASSTTVALSPVSCAPTLRDVTILDLETTTKNAKTMQKEIRTPFCIYTCTVSVQFAVKSQTFLGTGELSWNATLPHGVKDARNQKNVSHQLSPSVSQGVWW